MDHIYNIVLPISANVMKWEKAVADDEKELEKVKNDETRNMEVNQSFFLIHCN